MHLRIALPVLLTVALFIGAMFLVVFPSLEHTVLDGRKRSAEELVASAVQVMHTLQAEADRGRMTRSEAQALAVDILRSMRYGQENKDYFWINDLTPRMIMHPYRPDLEGQDLSEYADPQGKRLFMEMVRVVRYKDPAPVEYLWQWKDDPNRVVPKIAYVKLFEPWGWIVGTGVYLRDVQAEINRVRGTLLVVSLGILLLVLLLAMYIIMQARKADTRRRELFDALAGQEALYRSLLDNMPSGVILVNRRHEILAANARMHAWFPDLDLEARPICQLSLPDPRSAAPCVPCPVDQTFIDGAIHSRSLDIPAGGEMRTFRVTASPVRDPFGQ
ncbi:MAG: cache domain-containing protein, partial [Desulfovibrionaceae bacterium]